MNSVALIAAALQERQWRLVTAESCTGGRLASHLASLPGSADWFEGAFVTNRPEAKIRMLGVRQTTLERATAVSEQVAREMAIGALQRSDADISVAITGFASGGDANMPHGRIWFAWGIKQPDIVCVSAKAFDLGGDREEIRASTVSIALKGALDLLSR